ncbi:MAG: A/G-specific adenine glycosylase [Isosphaeraceae bacterium]
MDEKLGFRPSKKQGKIGKEKELEPGAWSQTRVSHDWIESVQSKLVTWYHAAQRDLPWRKGDNPYEILVSEMMLVQTTVTAVIPLFERFIKRFPDPQSLAAATEVDVLKAWEGLGYYRRARQLQAAARIIVHEYGGKVPRDIAAVQSLPGVGRYITGAILSCAFDLPEPIVEANSQRVLARLLAWREDLNARTSRHWLWDVARQLVPSRDPGKFNQGLMDLGAMVCTPHTPSCLVCPLSACCESRRLGLQDVLPVNSPRPAPLMVIEACAVVVQDGAVLVVRRKEGGLWSKFWEFPTVNLDGADPAGRSFGHPVDLTEGIKRLTGIQVRLGPEVHTLTYTVTKHRVCLRVHFGEAVSGALTPGPGLTDARFVPPTALADLPLGSPTRKLTTWMGKNAWHFARAEGDLPGKGASPGRKQAGSV